MENKEKNFVSAVIYVYNAEGSIEKFLKAIIELMENNFEHSEIICVNDGSNDSSVQKIKKLSSCATTTSISLINMSCFHGLELAMSAGMDLSIGDFLFEFDDTTLDFDSNMVMKVYYHALKGFDIVSASASRKEKLMSRMFYKIFNYFSETSYQMHTESFRILSRRAVNRVCSMNKTVPYRKVLYANCGLKSDNMKYEPIGEKGIQRHDEKKYKYGLAVDTLILFTNFGYRFSMSMTILMVLISIVMVLCILISYLKLISVEGWATTILLLSILFFGLFSVLTIIVKYLQLLLNMVFKNTAYEFENIEKLTK